MERAARWWVVGVSATLFACGTLETDADAAPERIDVGLDAHARDAAVPGDTESFDVASPLDARVADAHEPAPDTNAEPTCRVETVDASVEGEDAGARSWRSEAALRASGDPAPRYLGWSAASSSDGQRAILGAPFDDTVHAVNAGTARVFVLREGAWVEEAVLLAADGVEDERLGYSVALSAEGERAIVGSVPRDAGERGRALVFLRTGDSWAREATLVAADPTSGFAGLAVAISADACRALVSAERAVDGSRWVRVFARVGSTWVDDGMLVEPGPEGHGFGSSVALDATGERAIVGVPADDTAGGLDAGSARVFVRGPGGWVEEARLIASDGQAAAAFGRSVTMSADGRWVAVGAEQHDEASLVDVGRVWIFRRDDSTWIEDATLAHPVPDIDAYFGSAVSLDARGERALVGARYDDTPAGMHAGSAHVFVRVGGSWRAEAALFDPAAAAGDSFGRSAALSARGDRALVSAFYAERTSGGAQVFELAP